MPGLGPAAAAMGTARLPRSQFPAHCAHGIVTKCDRDCDCGESDGTLGEASCKLSLGARPLLLPAVIERAHLREYLPTLAIRASKDGPVPGVGQKPVISRAKC